MDEDGTPITDDEHQPDYSSEFSLPGAGLIQPTDLLDALSDSIFLHDLRGNILYANQAACITRGYTKDDIPAMTVRDLVSPAKARRVRGHVNAVLQLGHSVYESENIRKDGSVFPVEISARVMQSEKGLLVLSVVRDITRRKKVESQIRESRRLLEDVTQGIQEGIFLVTSGFEILWANKTAIKASGYEADQVIGNMCYKVSHGIDHPCGPPSDPCPIVELRKTGEPITVLHRHVDKDKTASFVEVSAYPTQYENGTPVEFAHVSRDVTERVRGEEELRQLNTELEAFSYTVSHDLRAPLRSIHGFSEIILEDHAEELSDEARRLLEVVIRNSRMMSELISALLAFSQLGHKELAVSQIDMNVLAAEVVKEVSATTHAPVVEFSIHDLPGAKGDELLIRQVLANLLSNAVKYSSNSERPAVEVGGIASDLETTYWVKDNGAGFDSGNADRLFKVFSRLHGDEFEGTGIGLASVQRIVERHGGSVRAENSPGHGATFYFTLPK